MTTAALRSPSTVARIRCFLRRHPEYGAVVAAAAAWASAIALHLGHAESTPTSVRHHGGTEAAIAPAPILLWALMCVAMMVPVSLPAIRHVGINSLRWRRQRAIAIFLAAYLGVWVACGLAALPVIAFVRGHLDDNVVLAMTVGAAAVWQLLPYQRRFLRACHRTVPLPPRGRRAAAGSARFGLRYGRACVGVCGPLMLVMAAVVDQALLAMVAITAVVACIKLLPRSDRLSGPIAFMLGTYALTLL
ncbi:DUF2182 domain-containing protein [Rhodococcus maanshanensis]|uniref:Predicted metal-binding membrane protein n=1 Tax=Rhodococcus maanshanensis TaxID=183556 RepID=A0A1H7Q8T5_9NOCA|nr:DUF2182 domain-containing protein [Rhodococcus maanshanensis]SEL44084.1 Predicted metal-binding membrane protein [Rhodococcus maanshanensis]